MIELVLRISSDNIINNVDKSGRSALHLAAANYEYLSKRKDIPKSKFHIDEIEYFQIHNSIISTAEQRSFRSCEILLQHGATVEIFDIQVCLHLQILPMTFNFLEFQIFDFSKLTLNFYY